ncbi:flagellar assembly protein T N-terminal domain-containing protein [Alteromonas sp. AMM-1]|uniref:flagellar assembly protein T N-terminal domain-containing protein n=1 Tax=Alteromonas sp. AMM-1 TaxID=3394233 RepID=UPI0039A5585C
MGNKLKYAPISTPYQWALFCLLICLTGQSYAAWFETQGQAAVINGNKVQAKQDATQEALRQAMLFAGASVTSVQQLTNGLLNSERLEISASSEVKELQLVSETWHDNYVTVRIRADIFPAEQQCDSASYMKTIATSYFPVMERQHTQDGQIQEIGEQFARQLQQVFDNDAQYGVINALEPYTIRWQTRQVRAQATALAAQTRSQFVLTGVIEDISVHRPEHSTLAFWEDNTPTRSFRFRTELIDGVNGAPIFAKTYSMSAEWEFDKFAQLDASNHAFWQSAFGKALHDQVLQIQSDIDLSLACVPATGRVIQVVANNELSVSLGRQHGVMVGDELALYQIQEINNPRGDTFLQYRIHPVSVTVVEAYANSSLVKASDDSFLANIQPNDFVVKR